MLNFFRKIRKQLAEENKPKKYLRYALGEIVLVVFGILIALSINNWNQQKKEAIVEQKALANLKNDFEYNQDMLCSLILESDRIINDNLLVLSNMGTNYNQDIKFNLDSLLNSLAHSPNFFPKNGFLDDLLNSGNLGIFSNDTLRQYLSMWKPSLELLKQRGNYADRIDSMIEDYISKHGSWMKYDAHYGNYDFQIMESGFETDNNNLLMHREFENLIDNHIYQINALKQRQKETLGIVETILIIINNELNK